MDGELRLSGNSLAGRNAKEVNVSCKQHQSVPLQDTVTVMLLSTSRGNALSTDNRGQQCGLEP